MHGVSLPQYIQVKYRHAAGIGLTALKYMIGS
jgi:hypothetical protein